MSIEGYIKCSICHEWLSPDRIDIDWLNSGDNVCHYCGNMNWLQTGNCASTANDQVEAIAGYFMGRINNLHATIQDLRNMLGGKDRYIDMQRITIDDLTESLQKAGVL